MNILLVITTNLLTAEPSLFAQWQTQVVSEGHFVRVHTVAPCAFDDPAAPSKAAQLKSFIWSTVPRPGAVQIFGAVPNPRGGWKNPDGHGSRAFFCDRYYGSSASLTDATNYGASPANPQMAMWANFANDGAFDDVSFRNEIAVGRVDFSQIPEAAHVGTIPSGPDAGKLRFPAVNEIAATREYLTRNLAYRRRTFAFTTNAILAGNLWGSGGNFFRLTMAQLAWSPTSTSYEPLPGRWYWQGVNLSNEDLWMLHSTECFGIQVYRSFAMEQYTAGAGARRRLKYALWSTWGNSVWYVPPTAQNMAQAFLASANPKLPWHYTFAGDVTLPTKLAIVNLPNIQAPVNLRIE